MKRRVCLWFGVVFVCAVLAILSWFLVATVTQHRAGGLSEVVLAQMSSFELGEYYFNQDTDTGGPYDLDKARHYYLQVLDEEIPGKEVAWYQLGRIDFLEGRLLASIHKFNKQLELYGDMIPNVYYGLGLSYAYKARGSTGTSDDFQKAEEAFTKYIEFDPVGPWPRIDLSWVYFLQGKYDEMIPHLEIALEHSPRHAWVLNTYGLALLNTDDPEAALHAFEEAQVVAGELTTEDWAGAYRGNSPEDWKRGLREFRSVIDENVRVTKAQLAI